MAGGALVFTVIPDKVLVVIVTLALDPVGFIDRMHTVWPLEGAIREAVGIVTDRAFLYGSRMSLQLDCSDVVIGIRIPVGPDGMGTAMTGFAGNAGVIVKTVTVQGAGILGETGIGQFDWCCCRVSWIIGKHADRIIAVTAVTGTAFRFIGPGLSDMSCG